MRRAVPTSIAMAVGILVLADFFLDQPLLNAVGRTLVDWVIILSAFALILGLLNILHFHARRIQRREGGWPYSLALWAIAAVILVAGLGDPRGPQQPLVQALFERVQAPLQSSVFALLAFYMAFAAYRAFRVRNLDTLLMVATGLAVLVGQMPLARDVWAPLPAIKEWILEVPATAGARGIVIGVALGTLVTGMRVLFGVDRPYSE
ncbi:MAG: hypothetical protein HYZ68_00505 [Chloroflexi bacterium]|nr:hypothetical protein [Chloroflexota bacterium]